MELLSGAAYIGSPIAGAVEVGRSQQDDTALTCCICRRGLVFDPVQLACLHNCCRSCAAKAAAETKAARASVAVSQAANDRESVCSPLSLSLLCTLCGCQTPLSAVVPNSLVAIRAKTARMRSALSTHCDACCLDIAMTITSSSSSASPEPMASQAEWWCTACASFFCSGCCSRLHARFSGKHAAIALTDARAAAAEAELSAEAEAAIRCDAHAQPYDLVCLTCAVPQCRLCPATCTDRAHHMASLDDRTAANERVSRAIDELRQRLGTLKARAEVLAKAEEAAAAAAASGATANNKQRPADIVPAIAQQRAECEHQIDSNWTEVERAVERAFDAARQDILRHFDKATGQAEEAPMETLPATGRFDEASARAALAYATCLADCGDVAAILLQEERVLTALRDHSRKADMEVDAARASESRCSAAAAAAASYRTADDLPANMGELMRLWIGKPRQDDRDPDGDTEDAKDYDDKDERENGHWPGSEQDEYSGWLGMNCEDLDYRVLRFVGAGVAQSAAAIASSATRPSSAAAVATPATTNLFTSFRMSMDCFDVALMSDGRLLLAARDNGLIECAGDSGAVLSKWQPQMTTKESDCVTSVAIASAVRRGHGCDLVAAGLLSSRCVSLLIPPPSKQWSKPSASLGDRPNLNGWTEARRLAWPGSRPWHIAVHDDLLAVTDAQNGDTAGKITTGPQLTLITLSRSRVMLRKQLDYPALGVAVTAATVIAAASEPAAGGLGLGPRRYPIDCFSHSGQLLWRCSFDERASNVVAPRLLGTLRSTPGAVAVLYVAFAELGKVIAISATDGRQLADIFDGSGYRSSCPLWLSLAEFGSDGSNGSSNSPQGRMVMASLANDNRTVTLRASLGAQ